MPQFNLLLLPLLGGFIFATKWFPLKYHTQRADTYRLVFTASIAGAVFFFLASVLVYLANFFPGTNQIDYLWHAIFPLPNSGRATLAFLLGVVMWWPANKLKYCDDKRAIDRAILKRGDPMEMLLRRALGEKKFIATTLKCGKVYVGRLRVNFNPAYEMESITFLPYFSGYRDKDTQELEITTDYTEPYEPIHTRMRSNLQERLQKEAMAFTELPKDTLKQRREKRKRQKEVIKLLEEHTRAEIDKEYGLEDYEMAIPIDEVQSVRFFDIKIWNDHFKSKRQIAPKSLTELKTLQSTTESVITPSPE